MDYLKKAGLVQEQKYEYLGADGFCRTQNFTDSDLTPFEVWCCTGKPLPRAVPHLLLHSACDHSCVAGLFLRSAR